LLIVTEKVKQGLVGGSKAGVVFFDFADAFGRVDRKCFLYNDRLTAFDPGQPG